MSLPRPETSSQMTPQGGNSANNAFSLENRMKYIAECRFTNLTLMTHFSESGIHISLIHFLQSSDNFPYCDESVKYEKVAKIGQGTFG